MHESKKWKWSRSVVSDPQRPHGLQPSRLLRPWDFPGKSTGVGCQCLLRPLQQRPQNVCLLLLPCGVTEKDGHLWTRKQTMLVPWPWLPASRSKFLLFTIHPVYGIFVTGAQIDWDIPPCQVETHKHDQDCRASNSFPGGKTTGYSWKQTWHFPH